MKKEIRPTKTIKAGEAHWLNFRDDDDGKLIAQLFSRLEQFQTASQTHITIAMHTIQRRTSLSPKRDGPANENKIVPMTRKTVMAILAPKGNA